MHVIRSVFVVPPVLFVIALTLAATASVAATGHAPASAYDGKVRHDAAGFVTVAPRAIEDLDPADALRAGWEAFRSRHGGAWRVYVDERTGLPSQLSGRGIQWLENEDLAEASLEDLEERARAFLAENVTLLGDWSTVLELDRDASTRLRTGHWQVVFRQNVDGVRVERARLVFHVQQGRLVLFGATKWAVPATNGVPDFDDRQARSFLDAYLGDLAGRLVSAGEPELVILPRDPAPDLEGSGVWTGERGVGLDHALIWRFRLREPGDGRIWVGEVDAHDGAVRAFYDGTQYAAIRGGVFPISNDGDCAEGGCEITGFPLPFADYGETGQAVEYSDPFGNLTCFDAEGDFETNLSGPYIHVNDHCGATSEFGTCGEGVDLGLKFGENCAVDPAGSPGNSAAARTAYYHLNRVAEVARFYDPDNTWLLDPVTVHVNVAGSCNAFWNGDINMYGSGGRCRNTGEEQGVTIHEWGHGYDHNDGGGEDKPGEAYADIVAILGARESCISRGMFGDENCDGYGDACLNCTGLRDMDWAARQNNTPVTPVPFLQNNCEADFTSWAGPCRREPHCESYLTSEVMFDLATRDLPASGMDIDTAWQLVDRLWYSTRPGSGGDAYFCYLPSSHSCGADTWYQRMLVADDDDGDLSNGTPHAAALFAAFDRHDIACGDASDPENQSTSGCPSLATPVLTVTDGPGGAELSWGAVASAQEYRVYRGELGCDRQQVPIASLAAGTTTFTDAEANLGLPRYYRVEAFGTIPACHSAVSNCEVSGSGARLQINEQRIVEDAVNSNGNGRPDPGETLQVPLTLFNSGAETGVSVAETLRLVESGLGRVVDPDATWADIPPGAIVESEAPHVSVTLLEETVCGETLTFEHTAHAANASATTRSFQTALGKKTKSIQRYPNEPIPPETTEPVLSYITFDEDDTLAEVDISVQINHDDETELIVEVTSPEGTTVRLHDQSYISGYGINTRYDLNRDPDGPGTMADFVGESSLGTWTLSVQDVGTVSSGNGTLVQWWVHATAVEAFDCETWTCPEPRPSGSPQDLAVDKVVDGAETDLVLTWTPLAGVPGHHVLQSISASFETGVELLARTTTESSLTLEDGANKTPAVTYFTVRGVNSCNQEGD